MKRFFLFFIVTSLLVACSHSEDDKEARQKRYEELQKAAQSQ